MPDKVAFVTGASRGIGKAIAIELAEGGYDVAITARTVHEGDAREHSSTLKRSDTSPLPGSLDTTADLVRSAGRRCLTVSADLLDHPSLVSAADAVVTEWTRTVPKMATTGLREGRVARAPLDQIPSMSGVRWTRVTRDHLVVMLGSVPLRSLAVVRSTFDVRRPKGNGDDRVRSAAGRRYRCPAGRP